MATIAVRAAVLVLRPAAALGPTAIVAEPSAVEQVEPVSAAVLRGEIPAPTQASNDPSASTGVIGSRAAIVLAARSPPAVRIVVLGPMVPAVPTAGPDRIVVLGPMVPAVPTAGPDRIVVIVPTVVTVPTVAQAADVRPAAIVWRRGVSSRRRRRPSAVPPR